jgi:hypothetical protein
VVSVAFSPLSELLKKTTKNLYKNENIIL